MRSHETGEISYDMKVRGIKQDLMTDVDLPYDYFKTMVKNYGQTNSKELWQHLFMPRLAEGIVYTKFVQKNFNLICPKGIIDDTSPSIDVYPHGF